MEVQSKNGETKYIILGEKATYVFGRNQQIVDIEINDHPSLSREHAAICHGVPLAPAQYQGGAVLIDLGSANGTFIGGTAETLQRIQPNRYELLCEGLYIRFGESPLLYIVRGLSPNFASSSIPAPVVANTTPQLTEAAKKEVKADVLGNLAVYNDSDEVDSRKAEKTSERKGRSSSDERSEKKKRHHRRSRSRSRSRDRESGSHKKRKDRSRDRDMQYRESPGRSRSRSYRRDKYSSRDRYDNRDNNEDRRDEQRSKGEEYRNSEQEKSPKRTSKNRELVGNEGNFAPVPVAVPLIPTMAPTSGMVDPVKLAQQKLIALLAGNSGKPGMDMASAQKKKGLWGAKKQDSSEPPPSTAKWATAAVSSLGDNKRQEKFLKMMGAKGLGPPSNSFGQTEPTTVFGTKTQQEYEKDLEQQYSRGLMYNLSRSGLGST